MRKPAGSVLAGKVPGQDGYDPRPVGAHLRPVKFGLRKMTLEEIKRKYPNLPGVKEISEPLLTRQEYQAAGLSENADKQELERKYAGGPDADLMGVVKQPLRKIGVLVTQSDLEQLEALSEKYQLERNQIAQALVRWALSRRKEWEGPAE